MALSIGEIYATLKLRDELSPALASAEKSIGQTGKQLQQIGSTMRSAGEAMLPLAAAATAVSYAVVKFGSDFETASTKLVTLSGVSEKAAAGMADGVMELSKSVGIGPGSLNSALLVVTSTGIRGAEALEILEMAAKGTAVGMGDTKDIARALTSAMTAYGVENLSAAEASEILFKTVREGGAEADELAGTLGRVVGIASQVGVSFDQVGTFMATLTRLGVDSAESVTALRGVLGTMLKPSAEARDQLLSLGWSIEGLRDSVKKNGLTSALTELITRTKGSSDAVAAIVPNVRALAGVMGTAGAQGAAMAEIQKTISASSDDLNKAFERVSQTVGKKMNQNMADMERISVKAFLAMSGEIDWFQNIIGSAIRKVESFVDGMKEWDSSTKSIVAGVTAALIGLPVVLIGVGSAIRVLGFAFEGLALATGGFNKVAGALGLNSLLHPFKILTAQVEAYGVKTGISTTASLLWSDAMTKLKGAQMWLWSNSKLYANISVYGLQAGISTTATSLWASAMTGLSAAFTAVRAGLAFLTGPIGIAVTAVSLLVYWFTQTEGGTKALGAIWKWLAGVGKDLWSIVESIGSIFKDSFAIGVKIAEMQLQALYSMFSPVINAAKGLKDMVFGLAADFKNFAVSLLDVIPGGNSFVQFLGVAKNGISGLAGLFKAAAGGVHQFATDIGAVKDELPQVSSPMRDLGVATSSQVDLTHLLSEEFTASITPTKKVGEGLGTASEEALKHAEAVKELAAEYNGQKVRDGFKLWEAALPKIDDITKRSVKEQEDLRDTLGELIDEAVAMGITVPPAVNKAYKALANNTTVKQAMRELAEESRETGTKIIEAQYEQARKVADSQNDQFWGAVDAAREAGERLYDITASATDKAISQAARQRDESLKAIEPLKTKWPQMYEQARAATLRVYDKSVFDAKTEGAKVVGTFTQEMAKLPEIIMGAIQGGGSVFKSVFSFIGTSIMSEENALTKMLHGGISKIATSIGGEFGANVSKTLSAALPGIGALLGPAMSALGSKLIGALFGSKGRDMVKEFAATFEGGFDGLRDKLNVLGAEGEKLWVNLTQGVGKNNPAQAKAAIEAIKEALARAEEETKAVNEAMKEYGITWKDFTGDTRAKMLADVIKELTTDTGLLVKAGLSHADALKAQADQYNKLIAESARAGADMPLDLLKVAREMASLGLLTEDTMAALIGGAQSALPKWQDMEEAAKKYGIELGSLGDKFRAAKLGDTLKEYAKDFDLLVRGGADAAAVAAGMADEVNAALSEALRFGIEVPASMRPLLESLLASGKLLDENGDALTDLSRVKFGETMADSVNKLISKLDDLIAALTQGVGGAIGTVIGEFEKMTQRDYDVRVNVRTNRVDGGGEGNDAVDMAAGGMFRVTKPTLFRAGEAGTEDVMFSGGGRSFDRPGAAVSPDGAGGNVYILVDKNGDTKDLTRAQFKQLERAMATGVVKVSRRSIGERVQ